MKRIMENVTVFLLGGGIYCCLEVLWRGYSHPSMAALGGLCVMAVYLIDRLCCGTLLKMLLCGVTITVLEGLGGLLVNILLGLQVWDYSALPLNLCGQVCVWFALLWFLLSYPALWFCRLMRRCVFA